MERVNSLKKIEDEAGANYIIHSCLTSFDNKTTSNKYSIKSVFKGVEYYTIDGKEYKVSDDNFIITNPDQEVEIHVDSSSDVIGICYFFDADLIQQIAATVSSSVEANIENRAAKEKFISSQICKSPLYNIPTNVFLTRFFHCLQTGHQPLDKQQVSEYLIRLAEDLILHQKETQQRLDDLDSIKTATKKELYKRLQVGRQFMHDNIAQPISLKEMAKAACLSEYYFHRTFRIFFQLTPHQYHQDIRMKHACQLLEQGKHTKQEVAFRCGFKDAKYFSKIFKKWTRTKSSF